MNFELGISNILCALLVGGFSIPLILEKIDMNGIYGIRFNKSFESDELWYQINKKGGQILLAWSTVLLSFGILCFFLPQLQAPYTFMFSLAPVFCYVAAAIQCHLYAKTL